MSAVGTLERQTVEPGSRAADGSQVEGEPIESVSGFYDAEADQVSEFRWMASRGEFRYRPDDGERYLELWVYSEFPDRSQTLTAVTGERRQTCRLKGGWSRLSLVVPARTDAVTLLVNKIYPPRHYPGDARELAVRTRTPLLHREAARHRRIASRMDVPTRAALLWHRLRSWRSGEPGLDVARAEAWREPPPDRPRRPKGWLGPEEDALVPPRELWIGPDDPISHYYRWVWEYPAYLTVLLGLRREDRVLELGCGHGRTARGLLAYLRPPGRYVGLDVNSGRIADARERISRAWPHFEFVHADVRNAQDNPGGIDAQDYRFPFEAQTFDVIYAASLFTHLLPDETLHYFKESRRVLSATGRCLYSFFDLNRYRGAGTAVSPLYEFGHALPGYDGVAVRDPKCPHSAISYRAESLEAMAGLAGLEVQRVIPGLWADHPGVSVHEQDLLLMVPAIRATATLT